MSVSLSPAPVSLVKSYGPPVPVTLVLDLPACGDCGAPAGAACVDPFCYGSLGAADLLVSPPWTIFA